MHNQEKHPVDELFAKRLREVERMPSPQAWEELQSRLTKKKDSRKGIYWAVAASVALLIGCFVAAVYWKSDEPLAITKPAKQLPARVKSSQLPVEQTQPAPVATVTPDKPETLTQPAESVQQKTAPDNKPAYMAKNQPKPVITTKVEEVKTVVEEPQEKIAVATAVENQPKKTVTPEVTVVVVELSEPVAANPSSTDEATEEEDVPATKKAGKLWQAIKKAKKSEINLDKEAIVAWVKERNNKN